MGKIRTQLNWFSGGITNDPRDPARNVARYVANFDILTSPRKMIPYRSSESGEDTVARTIRNYQVAVRTGSTFSLYGMGRTSAASDVVEIYYKDLTIGADNDLDDAQWTETANNVSASGAPSYVFFTYYRQTGRIYGAKGGNTYFAYDPTGSVAFDEDGATHSASATYTELSPGVIHSKDDNLYVGRYNNAGAGGSKSFVDKNDSGTWSLAALTLPDHYIPTSICEWGNFLAIGCAHSDGVSNSRIFLWDRSETTPVLAESIDAGSGSLIILEEVDGELIAISQKGGRAGDFGLVPRSAPVHRNKVIFRRLDGNTMVKIFELQADHADYTSTTTINTTQLGATKRKVDNRLLFEMLIELNGAVRSGIWSIGRSGPGQPFSLIHERTPNNNTALTSASTSGPRGFFIAGDFLFQSYSSAGTFAISKTDDTATYSHNSVWESKIFDGRDSNDPSIDASYYKDLHEISIQTEELPTDGSVTVDYQVDENIGSESWTTLFTHSTDDSVSHSRHSGGATMPKDYKQISFRILATGGAIVTGFVFDEEEKGRKNITD